MRSVRRRRAEERLVGIKRREHGTVLDVGIHKGVEPVSIGHDHPIEPLPQRGNRYVPRLLVAFGLPLDPTG